MITKEQEKLNELEGYHEFREKIEALLGEYGAKVPTDMIIGALEASKLKLTSFAHHLTIERMKKEGKI